MKLGYALLAEQSGPADLVHHAVLAEQAGFDFEAITDSFAPWLASQGHAPNAWPVLGAIAHATQRVELMTFATSAIGRYHPALIAQLAGTVGVLCEGRFTLGLGVGENINESALGRGWPSHAIRLEMLGEAIEIIEALVRGSTVNFSGRHFQTEGAQLWDRPQRFPAIAVPVTGADTAVLAGRRADAMLAYAPDGELVQLFEDNGGLGAPRIAQLIVSFDRDLEAARARAHEQYRWRALGPEATAHAGTPDAVDVAARFVRQDDTAEAVTCGDDVAVYVAAVKRFADAGFSHLAIGQVGGDQQEPFLDWARDVLLPELRSAGLADQI